MTYQEKKSIVNMISGLLITAIYALIVYQRHQQGQFDLTQDFKAWGIVFLIFVGISIVARIIIYIIFHIINTIATREVDIPITDERDRLIELKATRNSYIAYMVSFLTAMVLLALGMPVFGLFICLVCGGLLSEIIENSSKIYYHRKGIQHG